MARKLLLPVIVAVLLVSGVLSGDEMPGGRRDAAGPSKTTATPGAEEPAARDDPKAAFLDQAPRPERGGAGSELVSEMTGLAGQGRRRRLARETVTGRREITKALARKGALTFRGVPVLVAIRRIAEIAGVNLVVGPEAEYAAEGAGRELRINLSMRDASLRNMLDMVMRKSGLAYEVVNRAVYVTTPEGTRKSSRLRVYDVRDVAIPTPDFSADGTSGFQTGSRR